MTHLLYVDDLKLFTLNEKKIDRTDKTSSLIKRFSEYIQMEFGRDKCTKCTFVEGKPTKPDNIKIHLETTIQQLENGATYKSLGVEKGHQICHKQMSKTITKEYRRKIERS